MTRDSCSASLEGGLSGRDIAWLRRVWLAALAATVTVAILVFDAGFPAGVAIAAILVGLAANVLAARHGSGVTMPLLLDVSLLGVLLAVSGGLANPFAALLPAPAFVGALSAEPRSAGRVAALAVVVAGFLAFAGEPREPVAWLTLCALAALAAFAGRRAELVSKAGRDAAASLPRDGAAHIDGIAFAAAAHEIASPLSTIRVAAAELARDLADMPQARADAVLIEREALRCGAILEVARGSGGPQAPRPISEIVADAAAPHRDRGVEIRVMARGSGPEPRIGQAGDAALGLRAVIQNAVDFAHGAVTVETAWSKESVDVTVSDDGEGFDARILEGSPPVPGRGRPRGGPGTGSGLALARALLARSGGAMELGNAAPNGARVRVAWMRAAEHG